jgi:hypothetical protein
LVLHTKCRDFKILIGYHASSVEWVNIALT